MLACACLLHIVASVVVERKVLAAPCTVLSVLPELSSSMLSVVATVIGVVTTYGRIFRAVLHHDLPLSVVASQVWTSAFFSRIFLVVLIYVPITAVLLV